MLPGVVALACLNSAARAQAVDYGALEEVYGESVTTSATGKPQRASDVPADMAIITQDDIRRSGADNIPDILQFVTGIDIRRYSFGDTQVAVRGYGAAVNPRLLVLVDGRQVYSDDYGYVAWNAIPVQLGEIRQIEVVRGPNTALFGFNAASGVINIITYDPLLDNRNTATVRGGTQGYGEGDAVATQHFGPTAGVRVSVGGWTATGFKQPDPVSEPSPRYASVNVDGRWQVSPNLLLSASGGDTDAHTERDFGIPEQAQDRLSYGRVGAAANTALGTVDIDAYRNEALNSYGTAGFIANTTYVVRGSDLARLSATNVVRIGLEYRNNSGNSPAAAGTVSYDDFAANAMWNWQISPAVELTNAVRIDRLALHHGALPPGIPGLTPDAFHTGLTTTSFNSGLVMRLTDADTLRILLSRGLQLPSLTDFSLHESLFGILLLGSPHLTPTSVWNAELAYDGNLPWLGATLQIAVFLQKNTDLLIDPGTAGFQQVDGHTVSISRNGGASTEIGAEIGLHGVTGGGFRWNASYRYSAIADKLVAGVNSTSASTPDVGTPRHVVILGAGYGFGRWEFDIQGRGQTRFIDYADVVVPQFVPGYVSFNARIGCRVTDYLTIAGSAGQFNMARILEGAGSYADRRFVVSATLKY